MQISKELYNIALKRVEELLPLVTDDTPKDAPEMVELCHFSDSLKRFQKNV